MDRHQQAVAAAAGRPRPPRTQTSTDLQKIAGFSIGRWAESNRSGTGSRIQSTPAMAGRRAAGNTNTETRKRHGRRGRSLAAHNTGSQLAHDCAAAFRRRHSNVHVARFKAKAKDLPRSRELALGPSVAATQNARPCGIAALSPIDSLVKL